MLAFDLTFFPLHRVACLGPLIRLPKVSATNKSKHQSVSRRSFTPLTENSASCLRSKAPALVESIANVKVLGSTCFSHSHGALWDSASWDMLSRNRTGKQVLAMTAYEDYKEVLVMVF